MRGQEARGGEHKKKKTSKRKPVVWDNTRWLFIGWDLGLPRYDNNTNCNIIVITKSTYSQG